MSAVDGYDLVMIGILLTAAVLGYFKGIVWQLAWIAGIVVSSFVAIRYSLEAAPFFGEREPWNRLLAMLALYAATSVGVWLLFRLASKAIDAIHLSSFDHQLGLLFGAAKGVLLCMVMTFFAVTLAPAYRGQIVASRSGRIVGDLLASADAFLPPDLHSTISPYLDRFEQQLNDPADPQQPSTRSDSGGESPLQSVWKGVQSVAAWAGVEPTTAEPANLVGQGESLASQAGGPLPEGSSWFAAPQPPSPQAAGLPQWGRQLPSGPAASVVPGNGVPPQTPASVPYSNTFPVSPTTPPQPTTGVPGGYRVGTQSPLPQRW